MTLIFLSRLICFEVIRFVYGRSYIRGNTSDEGFEVVRSQYLSHSMCNRCLTVCTRKGKNTPSHMLWRSQSSAIGVQGGKVEALKDIIWTNFLMVVRREMFCKVVGIIFFPRCPIIFQFAMSCLIT